MALKCPFPYCTEIPLPTWRLVGTQMPLPIWHLVGTEIPLPKWHRVGTEYPFPYDTLLGLNRPFPYGTKIPNTTTKTQCNGEMRSRKTRTAKTAVRVRFCEKAMQRLIAKSKRLKCCSVKVNTPAWNREYADYDKIT